MNQTNAKNTITPQRGIAIVEFAIVLPILLLLMLGVAEFGRAFFQYNTLTKAVRDGARYYSTDAFIGDTQTPNGAAQGNTVNLVQYGNIAGSGSPLIIDPFQLPGTLPSVTSSTTSDLPGTYVSVNATY
ncbi:MAG: TadE family protein, partial [Pseudomonadota bacterium]